MTNASDLLQRISSKRDTVTSFKAGAPVSMAVSVSRLARQSISDLGAAVIMLRRPSQLGGSTRKSNLRSGNSSGGSEMTFAQIWHLAHRVITAVAAILYCIAALHGSMGALNIMRSHSNPTLDFAPYSTLLMGELTGTTSIANSSLMELLNFQVTPRKDTLYVDLDENTQQQYTSFTGWASANEVDDVYANSFLRSIYDALVRDTSYNLTFLSDAQSEIIAPVVDCTSSARVYADSSVIKVFFLVNNKQPQPDLQGADRAKLLTLTLSNQGYKVPSRDEKGPLGVATLTFFHSLEQRGVTHYFALSLGYPYEKLRFQVYEYMNTTADAYWTLRSIPNDASTQVSKTLMTASRTGFYWSKETEQANIKNEYWTLSDDPIDAISNMQWTGRAVLTDAWAWPHLVHFFLGLDVIVQILILLIVVYRNWQEGKLWIGDAFMCISKTLQLRGLLVVGSWYLNTCWALIEYLYFVGDDISAVEQVFILREIVEADLMTLYLAVVDLVAKVAQERLDPALSLLLFFVTSRCSPAIIRVFPTLVEVLNDKTLRDYQLGVVPTLEDLSKITPMRLWNVHLIGAHELSFTLAAVFPLLLSLGLLLALVLAAKLRRRWKLMHQRSAAVVGPLESTKLGSETVKSDGDSTNNLFSTVPATPQASSSSAAAGTTRFELATGVELAHQFGLRCSYDNLRTIKGLKYVSADGIYSNGFVITNKAFVVSTEDVLAILLTKLLRFRYRNIYVYDVEGGHNVQQMARLVCPGTLAIRDPLNLSITTLA